MFQCVPPPSSYLRGCRHSSSGQQPRRWTCSTGWQRSSSGRRRWGRWGYWGYYRQLTQLALPVEWLAGRRLGHGHPRQVAATVEARLLKVGVLHTGPDSNRCLSLRCHYHCLCLVSGSYLQIQRLATDQVRNEEYVSMTWSPELTLGVTHKLARHWLELTSAGLCWVVDKSY